MAKRVITDAKKRKPKRGNDSISDSKRSLAKKQK